jgi:hypothetical protein
MNNEQKAQRYNYLMSQFDVLRNKIADIKITQVNLTEEQERNIAENIARANKENEERLQREEEARIKASKKWWKFWN